MDKMQIRQLLQNNRSVCSIWPDYIMVTDALSDKTIDAILSEPLVQGGRVIVCIDHDTPNSSIDIGARQRRLIRWAVEKGLSIESCQGIGYIRLIEKYIQEGQIVAGTGSHMAGLGSAGALGITVTEEELLSVISGRPLQLTCPSVQRIAIRGSMAETVSAQDAALALLAMLKQTGRTGDLLLFAKEDMTGFSQDQCCDFCHLLQQAGGFSAIIMDTEQTPSMTFDISAVCPLVVQPGNQTHIVPLKEQVPVPVQEVFIGGCRGGKVSDLRAAASVLRGKRIAYRLRLIVAPATSTVYLQALQEGLIDIFLDAGAVVMNQGCSVCWGRAQGILDAGETLVSTGSYHYPGCSGDVSAKVYLTSPQVAARCALSGILQE
ncbi:aconitase family protein [uncultured Megasphaera sp.]|uniref:aconitase family protein n=1 Tax=uncultured Megasphaera sp. TaxID=165188 RepID=UPI0025F00C7A|nr:aconitase family protein [uncultured Megasphaera sp.]